MFSPSRNTAQERDQETGLDYFGARYFSGAQGRFTSPDEVFAGQDEYNPQSWNLYNYVRNNPLRYTDRDGRACTYDQKTNNFTGDCASPGDENVTQGNVKQQFTVGVGRDEAMLLMLAGIGETITNPHAVAQFVSDAGRSAASIIAPGPSAVAECITPGGNCNKTNLALAAVPFGPGRLARILRKHSSLSTVKNASKFAKGLDDAAHVESMIESALASPNRARGYADGAAYVDANLGVTIGTDPVGKSTTTIRVVLDEAGNVHSAFPIPQHP